MDNFEREDLLVAGIVLVITAISLFFNQYMGG